MRSSIVSTCIIASLFAIASVSSAQTRSSSSSSSSSTSSSSGKCSAQTLQKVSSGVSTAVRSLQGSKVSSTLTQAVQSDATALMQFARMSSATLAQKQPEVTQALQKLATDLSNLSGDANLSAQARTVLSVIVAQVQQLAQNTQQKSQ